jgi:hypothetical protein
MSARRALILILVLMVGFLFAPWLNVISAADPTATPTKTATNTTAAQVAATVAVTPTNTSAVPATLTPTKSNTPAATLTPTKSVTTTSATLTPTKTLTTTKATLTPTNTVTNSVAITPTKTITVSGTITATKTATPTPTRTPTKVLIRARGSTSKSFSTTVVLVNMGSATANVTAAYTKPDGSAWAADSANTTFTISNNFGQRIISQAADATMTSGQGSAVISSDQQLGGIVEILSPNQTSSWSAYSSSAPANQFYVPQVIRQRGTSSGLANTQIIIQSTESSGSITATVNFIPYPGSGFSAYPKTGITLQPGASLVYDIADESSANLPDGWYGSAVVTAQSGKSIVVVANLFYGANSIKTFSGFATSAAGPSWSMPHFVSRIPNGLSTGVIIQNVSGVEIPINGIVMNCKSPYAWSTPSTFTLYNNVAVPANANFVFNPVADLTIPGNWSGACRLTTTDKNVVVFVEMRFPGANDNFAAYEAFRSDSTNTKVVFPMIAKRQSSGFATVATIQNLDLVNSAAVKLTYYPSYQYIAEGGSSTPLVYLRTIAADSSLQHNHRLGDLADSINDMPDGWYGTLYVEPQSSGTARPIIGYAQLTSYTSTTGDNWMAVDAFPLP